jgi:hypothetical protein
LDEVRRLAYEGGQDIHAAPLMLMFDFAEPIDGVALLARSGSAKNCSQLLRTALEVQLSSKYMMEHKGTYEQRCLAYEFYHLQDQLRWAQRCDPESQVGKQLRAELAGDPLADIFDVKGRDLTGEASDLEAKMNSARYNQCPGRAYPDESDEDSGRRLVQSLGWAQKYPELGYSPQVGLFVRGALSRVVICRPRRSGDQADIGKERRRA